MTCDCRAAAAGLHRLGCPIRSRRDDADLAPWRRVLFQAPPEPHTDQEDE